MNPVRLGLGLSAVRGPALAVFIFHRVLAKPDPLAPYEPDARWFDGLMGRVREWFNVLPLGEAVEAMRDGRLPARAACITFDDGYADNLSIACPILRRHGLDATVFVATGYLDGGRMWNDTIVETVRRAPEGWLESGEAIGRGRLSVSGTAARRSAIATLIAAVKYRPVRERIELAESLAREVGVSLPADLMMRSEEVLTLRRQGIGIGAHTCLHPILAITPEALAECEIRDSRDRLAGILGEKIDLFAYPNGRPGRDYERKDVDIVRRLGFRAAVSTRPAIARPSDDPFEIPRFTPWDRPYWKFAARMMKATWEAPTNSPD